MKKLYQVLRQECGVLALLLIAVSFASGARYEARTTPAADTVSVIRENSPEYNFINPTLFVDNSSASYPELDALDAKMRDIVNGDIKDGSAENIAVYFRDLNSSHWTGVDVNDLFAPSSMLKLVTLVAYLKHAETDQGALETQIRFEESTDPGQYYKPGKLLSPGVYTVRDLLIQMITQSDNAAMDALNKLHPDWLKDVYTALELPNPSTPKDDFMSAEMYSRLYRTLYGSTYLSRDYSEQALKLLSITDFNKGLTQGTASTTVSHKFGEHTLTDDLGTVQYRELHDCGIVYLPDHPYFLCVMTRGQDFSKLERVIADISRTVYADRKMAQ